MDRIASEQRLASSGEASHAVQIADHLREIKRQQDEIRQLQTERAALVSAVKEAEAGYQNAVLIQQMMFDEVRREHERRFDELTQLKASMSWRITL